MSRSFEDWFNQLDKETKKKITSSDGRPLLNEINYLCISEIINNSAVNPIPSVDEVHNWIISNQIDAKLS